MVNVDLTIQGMIALFFEKNAGGEVVACQAGVLKDAEHRFDLQIARKGSTPSPIPTGPINRALKLEVSPNPSISFAPGDIDRQSGAGAPQSFQWVLDFEGPEVYAYPIGSSEKAFQSILHINGGEFFTRVKSMNKLILFDEKLGNCTNIGIVATSVGLRIELAEGQSAKFLNGLSELFTATLADVFEVKLLHDRHTHGVTAVQHHGDANFFYTAVGHKIQHGEKKVFSSTLFPAGTVAATPEASCLVPTGGKGPIQQP